MKLHLVLAALILSGTGSIARADTEPISRVSGDGSGVVTNVIVGTVEAVDTGLDEILVRDGTGATSAYKLTGSAISRPNGDTATIYAVRPGDKVSIDMRSDSGQVMKVTLH
jgi:hypothetical protein